MAVPLYQNQTPNIVGVPTKAGITIQVPPGKYVYGSYYANVKQVTFAVASPAAKDIIYYYPEGPEPYFVKSTSVPAVGAAGGKKWELRMASDGDTYVKVATAHGWVSGTLTDYTPV